MQLRKERGAKPTQGTQLCGANISLKTAHIALQ
jgi:hypothetical protein